ncbi:MAG: glutamate-cysteine ligase family protein [Phycisphaerae bacterium]
MNSLTHSIKAITEHFSDQFDRDTAERDPSERRIGSELKFPLVNASDGTAASQETVDALWDYLQDRGWEAVTDTMVGKVVGARKPGEQNDTLASCETGYCKPEFSLAHVADLHRLADAVRDLRQELQPFCEKHRVRFLGYGIQPVSPPSEDLVMKKGRTSVWDKVFGANRVLAEEDGDDMCLFTVNAASHVHLSVAKEEAVRAVNVLNGFSGAQLALTAHSSVWKGRVDPKYKCVAEMLWEWWMPETERVGVPEKRFDDLGDYVETVSGFRPVFVKREGRPVVLTDYDSFAEYFQHDEAVGSDSKGEEVSLSPCEQDFDVHSTCYWYNARLSRYSTVENRTNDQQPPDDLLVIPALSLGLVSALDEAEEELSAHDWSKLQAAREVACREALAGIVEGHPLADFASRMLEIAELGLKRRGLDEQQYLAPLWDRVKRRECPADEAARIFNEGGIRALVDARSV